MKTLIIGGAGYIGSVLTDRLASAGYEVMVIDNLRYKQKPLLNLCHISVFNFQLVDFRDIQQVNALAQKADCIIVLAAIVGAEQCDASPYDARTTNLDAVVNLCKNLSKQQMILYPCTNSGYGIGQSSMYCTEDSPLNPISLYGRTKVEAEKVIMERENSISFRLATVFGASLCMRTELLVNNFVLKALTDRSIVLFESHFKRNYIHVRDVARVFEKAIDNFDNMKGSVYNVGLSSANLSKLELCHKIKQYIDFAIIENSDRKDPDQRNYIVSNEKIESKGFKPCYSIDDGIVELMKFYKMSTISYYD